MEASTYKADGIFAKEHEDELMKFTVKYDYKVETNLVEKVDEVQMNGEMEVNITECTQSLGNDLAGVEYQDTTEKSSSFDDCDFGAENVDTSGYSEALSNFRGDAISAADFDGFGERLRMRKKKLTTHWRSYIQPLMWRCKWVELQIKKLDSQAQQYDRELEAYYMQKRTQLDDSAMLDGVKSFPFSRENAKNDVLKRKKRKRAEATTDVAAYMSHHNLFSCYENRKCFTEGAFMNNESNNPATKKINIDEIWNNDELLSFEAGDGDSSLEHVLWKIGSLQSQVGMLKSKVDRIMKENTERLSLVDNLTLSTLKKETETEGTYSSQSITVLARQISVTSHGDIPVANVSIGHACFGAHKTMVDGVPINSQRIKEENNIEEVKIHPIERPSVLMDGLGNTAPPARAEPNLPTASPPQKVRSIAKITAPKSKRKRGRKKGATGRRSGRSTG